MTNQLHRLAAGAIILDSDKILLVRDKHGWSLPKGSVEDGELMKETAEREVQEETGLLINVTDVAFISEYRSKRYGSYLQVYFESIIINRINKMDPDNDIKEILYVPVTNLREYITFKPWITPLEKWMNERVFKYYSYDLDNEGFYI
jgi:ADP-ribose pyrophosphatase YjhB (NUDIX family)